MHDTHCHLDLYEDPLSVATETENRCVFTVAVSNLPGAYVSAQPHMRAFKYLKLALGLHPLLAHEHSAQQRQQFRELFSTTDYIGEVGLDFSKVGIETKEGQIESFSLVLQLLASQPKVATLHSRRAEKQVVKMLQQYHIVPVIFHWYSGPLSGIQDIVERGDYFSVNPAMVRSKSGQKIINRIPRERLLTESDGPFVKDNGKPIHPAYIIEVHKYFANLWNVSISDVNDQLEENLHRFFGIVGCGG